MPPVALVVKLLRQVFLTRIMTSVRTTLPPPAANDDNQLLAWARSILYASAAGTALTIASLVAVYFW